MGLEPINESLNQWRFSKRIVNEVNERPKISKVSKTEAIADKLVSTFNSPNSRNFFLKCAWHLSEDTIWTAVERSKRKGIASPVRYFVKYCSNAMN